VKLAQAVAVFLLSVFSVTSVASFPGTEPILPWEESAVSTFYLLPSRPLLGERFAAYLQNFFPGLDWGSPRWPELADALAAVAAGQPDVYVVYREELPEGEDAAAALADGFGAAAGDEVIEIVPGALPAALTAKRWRLGADDHS
jgi:hypothetical protein